MTKNSNMIILSLIPYSVTHGGWGAWGTYGPCTATCGSGYQIRDRLCNDPIPLNGGLECSSDKGQSMKESESRMCTSIKCPGILQLRNVYNCVNVDYK